MHRSRAAVTLTTAALLTALTTGPTLAASAATTTPTPAAAATASTGVPAADPVPALNRAAYPLLSTEATGPAYDLRPFLRMVGDARVVGVGEATHSSAEFFTLKHRLFRALVEQRGFRAFALEGSWSTGLTLNRYVVDGIGDPRAIMTHEFQGSYKFWNVEEYLALIEWMRDYNRTHADKVHFVGNDVGYVSPGTLDLTIAGVGKVDPALAPAATRAYAALRSDANAGEWATAYLGRSLAERQRVEVETRRVLEQVEAAAPSPGRSWAVQNARAVWQVAKFHAYDVVDPKVLPQAMLFRDETMAANTAWWSRTTGDRTLLSAHNGHVALETSMPDQYPKTQGRFLREQLGRKYLPVGLSFDHGSFNSHDIEDPAGAVRKFTLPPAAAGHNEHTLDRVAYRDYVVDLRTLPRRTQAWLQVQRPTRDIGTGYPWPDSQIAIGASYDVLIHLNEVSAAHLR